jgi:hypothetical protein
MEAAAHGHVDILKLMLQRKADANQKLVSSRASWHDLLLAGQHKTTPSAYDADRSATGSQSNHQHHVQPKICKVFQQTAVLFTNSFLGDC